MPSAIATSASATSLSGRRASSSCVEVTRRSGSTCARSSRIRRRSTSSLPNSFVVRVVMRSSDHVHGRGQQHDGVEPLVEPSLVGHAPADHQRDVAVGVRIEQGHDAVLDPHPVPLGVGVEGPPGAPARIVRVDHMEAAPRELEEHARLPRPRHPGQENASHPRSGSAPGPTPVATPAARPCQDARPSRGTVPHGRLPRGRIRRPCRRSARARGLRGR
jgi:hypothetical protein